MNLLDTARAACADALALARLQRDGRAWAVVAWPSELDETPHAAFAQASGRRRTLLWHGQEWLLGYGEAWGVTCDGPGRGSHLAQELARLEARCVIACLRPPASARPELAPRRPSLPCVLTALSFEDHAPHDGHWGPHLPGARLWLPSRLLWRRSDGPGWTVAALAVRADEAAPAGLGERLLAEPAERQTLPPAPWPPLSDDYEAQVEDAVSLIHDGAMRKVVLARACDEALAPALASGGVLDRLREVGSSDSTVYAHDLDDGALFLGSSPELLFEACGLHVSTMALAGTSPSGNDPASDAANGEALMSCTKERKEHGVVVEHLVSVLRPRCAPFAVPSAPHVRHLGRLLHLETLVAAELRQADYLELLAALHPTPAVCGLPTATAVHYIARHERLQRGLYAGALGWLTPERCRFIVPLRGGILRGGRARLFAGAGIIETSHAAEEIAETELKFQVMREALGHGRSSIAGSG
jgi:salicylate biosynthesis isochorismate synthase